MLTSTKQLLCALTISVAAASVSLAQQDRTVASLGDR